MPTDVLFPVIWTFLFISVRFIVVHSCRFYSNDIKAIVILLICINDKNKKFDRYLMTTILRRVVTFVLVKRCHFGCVLWMPFMARKTDVFRIFRRLPPMIFVVFLCSTRRLAKNISNSPTELSIDFYLNLWHQRVSGVIPILALPFRSLFLSQAQFMDSWLIRLNSLKEATCIYIDGQFDG